LYKKNKEVEEPLLFRLTERSENFGKYQDKLLYLFAKHGQKYKRKDEKKQLKGLKTESFIRSAYYTYFFYVETDVNFNANFKNIEDRFVHKWKQKRIMPRLNIIP
jgi:hypothetical protein